MSCTRKRVRKCRLVCEKNEPGCQPFPAKGQPKSNLNQSYPELQMALHEQDGCVYCYVIETIKDEGGRFRQTGSGPNFQGGRITLCTCKHWMRTFKNLADWKGVWIAGFSGLKAGGGQNCLVYLMKIRQAFPSHRQLWKSLRPATRREKNARDHGLGDVFEPKSQGSEFRWSSYYQPVSGHVHASEKDPTAWHKDICYRGCSKRVAALLLGDVKFSFLWKRPLIARKGKLHRGQKKYEHLTAFLDDLITNEQA